MFRSKFLGIIVYYFYVRILHFRSSTFAKPLVSILTDKAAAPKPDVQPGIGALFPLRGNSDTKETYIECSESFATMTDGFKCTLQIKHFRNPPPLDMIGCAVIRKLTCKELLVSLCEVEHVKETFSFRLLRTGLEAQQNILR